VQREPGEPGGRAADANPVRKLDHRGAVPDGGHDALVAVAERDRRPPGLQPRDLVRGVLAHLQGRLGELRQRPAVDDRDVTDGEDPVLPGDPQVGAGADPAAARLRQAPAADRVRCRHASRPHRDVAGQNAPVGEHDLAGGDLGDGGAEPDLDAARGQLTPGVLAQRRVERRQQRGRAVDQRDVHTGRVDLGEERGEGHIAQVGEGAGQFHAGRAAADDGHRNVVAPAGAADLVQGRHDAVAQGDGVAAGVQAQAVLGCPGDAVVGGGHAGGQDEVVIAERRAVGQGDLPGRGVDAGQFAVPERRVVPAGEAADGVGDVAAGQPAGRHLVQQRLEGGIDVAVDQRGRHPGPGQPAHRG